MYVEAHRHRKMSSTLSRYLVGELGEVVLVLILILLGDTLNKTSIIPPLLTGCIK